MKALILYVLFIAVGAVGSAFVGFYIEEHISKSLSLVVFLSMFFANFVVCWLAVILVMDGSLKNWDGREEKARIEEAARKSPGERG